MSKYRIPRLSKEPLRWMMSALYFVRWDRFVQINKEKTIAYGWIPRSLGDTYKDFITLEYNVSGDVLYVTSSAEMDQQISDILGFGKGGAQCQRVEKHFKIVNMIKLTK